MTDIFNDTDIIDIDGQREKNELSIKNDVAEEKLSAWAQYAGNSDFHCAVYREIETGTRKGKQEKCFSFNPVDYTAGEVEDKCLAEYGGGQYWVKGYEKNRLRINENFCVAQPKAQKSVTDEIRELIPQLSGQRDDNMPLIQMMMQVQSEAAQRQSELMQSSQSQMMQLLTVLLPVMTQRPDTTNPMDMLVQLKTLEGQQNPIDMMFKGVELARELNTNVGGESASTNDLLLGLANTFGKPLVELAAAQPKSQPNTAAVKAQTVQTVQTDHIAMIENNPKSALIENIDKIILLAKAEVGHETAVDIIYTALNDAELERLHAFISDGECIKKLGAIRPDILDHIDYFNALREILLKELQNIDDCGIAAIDDNATVKNDITQNENDDDTDGESRNT